MVTDKNIYPLPEIVDARSHRQWRIEPSHRHGARVYLKHSLLMVPMDATPQSRMTRNHELGHIRWSPPKPHLAAMRNKLDIDVLQATEDMRINTKLSEIGVDTSSGSLSKKVAAAFADDLLLQDDIRNLILTMVAVIGQGASEDVFRTKYTGHELGQKAVKIADMAKRILWDRGEARFKDTLRTAKWLQAILDNTAPPESLGLPKKLKLSKGESEHLEQLLKTLQGFGTGRRATRKVPWGKMKIDTPPRVLKVDGYLGKGRLASEEGVMPRYSHRLLVDGRVFSRVRRQRGGSVLVDCSGSMSLDAADLQKILRHSPGAVVACYSGNTHDGVLRVLAQDGRQVKEEYVAAPAGGANVIDKPALDWLSKQPKPRVWVCDGQVTGVGDRQSALNTLECEALCRRSGVVRQDKVTEAVALLSRLGRKKR